MADVPHFAHPFRFEVQHDGTFAAAVEEQHSVDEIASCCERIASYAIGSRPELPTFGVTPQVFRQLPLDAGAFVTQIQAWEPRADFNDLEVLVDTDDPLNQGIRSALRTESEEA